MAITKRQIWFALAAIGTLSLIPLISSKVLAASGLDDDVKLLLHGNVGNNIVTTLRDSSFSDHTVTLNGDAKRATDKFSQSGFFDGSGDYLSVTDHNDLDFGTGDFTIDLWVRFNNLSGFRGVINKGDNTGGGSTAQWTLYTSGTTLVWGSGTANLISAGTVSAGSWTHLAVVRSSGTVRTYINGTQAGSASDASTKDTSEILQVGGTHNTSLVSRFDGMIDEVRISKGVARWTSNFTPPTAPYTSDANTSLLLHMDGTSGSTTFTDSSGSPKTVTANGDAKISSFSKFGGDGINFDGSGDYLTVPASSDFNFGTSDFTIDFWIRTSQASRAQPMNMHNASENNGYWGLHFNLTSSGQMSWYENKDQRINVTGTSWNNGSWHHVAVTRSGNSVRLFLDGAQVGSTYTTSFTYGNATNGVIIGINPDGSTGPLNGQLDEIRISKGVARWTSNFTPPTEAYGLGPAITLSGNVKFLRNIAVIDKLSKGAGTFVIDHPQKPRTHLLYHSFVESPEAKNIYDGIVELDSNGEATILLPDYFEALNKDFRYQYFPLGEAMPNLHVKEKVKNNQFVIAGGKPGGRVSWQVTGVRHDPYIEANPIRVEVEKGPGELVDKGECLHAEACP